MDHYSLVFFLQAKRPWLAILELILLFRLLIKICVRYPLVVLQIQIKKQITLTIREWMF